jgi:hypothetical protein
LTWEVYESGTIKYTKKRRKKKKKTKKRDQGRRELEMG